MQRTAQAGGDKLCARCLRILSPCQSQALRQQAQGRETARSRLIRSKILDQLGITVHRRRLVLIRISSSRALDLDLELTLPYLRARRIVWSSLEESRAQTQIKDLDP
ncbi:hypothetical protein RRG08_004796 [Elysia crispata]|uniref:Uncharacterized protein n=1 Tax=Elysia crispata TaxID=231223 RepID=A0AAE1CSP4_9GAST|nr:hypothetical protein RRG08_004796 [Elysia crispata]